MNTEINLLNDKAPLALTSSNMPRGELVEDCRLIIVHVFIWKCHKVVDVASTLMQAIQTSLEAPLFHIVTAVQFIDL